MAPKCGSLPRDAGDLVGLILIYSRIVWTSSEHYMILFIYLELSHLKQEELHNFSLEFICVLYFKFLERDGNRGLPL